MFFYLKDFSHTMVLAKKEHISFGSHDNFYCLIFAMYLGTTLMLQLILWYNTKLQVITQAKAEVLGIVITINAVKQNI